jgi:hypothetical protein
MAVFKCSMACLLAAILCGCSGFPAERAIRVPFSAIADSDADRLLTLQQVTELEDLLRLTDETFLRHGLGFTFREDEQDPSKWKRVFGHTPLRGYRPLPQDHLLADSRGSVFFRWHKKEVCIFLHEYSGWCFGSQAFRAAYSDMATNVVERFGPSRVKFGVPFFDPL